MAAQFGIPENPRILIVGGGAREHAIAWKLAQSPHQPVLLCAPGNPGIQELGRCFDVKASDVAGLVQLAVDEQVDLVVVGPEQPLELGLVDELESRGIRAFGPTEAAAQLETSKAFAKDLMQRAGVPTASYAAFTDAEAAKSYIRQQVAPIVVKADGLAAGKGVVVALSTIEALEAVDDMMIDKRFGAAGDSLIVESFLTGREVSLMFFVDGETFVPMIAARDHKRVGEGDTGPNTGGMGAFAPVASFVEAGLTEVVERTIVRPTLDALKGEGITYRGVLYVGLMVSDDGPYVVEFNARFGDPETEVVLPLLKTDLLEIMWGVSEQRLNEIDIEWQGGTAVCVVLAAPGYPAGPKTGQPITLDVTSEDWVFHAGTAAKDGHLITAGGRVLTVSAAGATMDEAREVAYRTVGRIHFEGMHLRRDIGSSWRE